MPGSSVGGGRGCWFAMVRFQFHGIHRSGTWEDQIRMLEERFEVVERFDAGELGGVDERHEEIAHRAPLRVL